MKIKIFEVWRWQYGVWPDCMHKRVSLVLVWLPSLPIIAKNVQIVEYFFLFFFCYVFFLTGNKNKPKFQYIQYITCVTTYHFKQQSDQFFRLSMPFRRKSGGRNVKERGATFCCNPFCKQSLPGARWPHHQHSLIVKDRTETI